MVLLHSALIEQPKHGFGEKMRTVTDERCLSSRAKYHW